MIDKQKQRLEELKKTSNDPKLSHLFEEMARLEIMLDDLRDAELYRRNPNNPTQIKVEPAFYLYHKTLSAYKEIVRVLLKSCDDNGETSPLRDYLNNLKSRDTEEFD